MSIADLDFDGGGPPSASYSPSGADDSDEHGLIKLWSVHGLAMQIEPRCFFTEARWAGPPPRPPVPASNRPPQQRTFAFSGHHELQKADPWHYSEDDGRAEALRHWFPSGGVNPGVIDRLLGAAPADVFQLIVPPPAWLLLLERHDGGLYFHVDKTKDGIVACWRNGFEGTAGTYGVDARAVESRRDRHLHLLAGASCEAAGVPMMRDIMLRDEDEGKRRFPWDGSCVDPFYLGHATSSEVNPTERAIPLLQGPRGLSASRLLFAEGGVFAPYPAATAATSSRAATSTPRA